MRKRVVITGLGLVCPLGTNVRKTWLKLLQGDKGFTKLEGSAYERLPCKVAAFVPKGVGDNELDVMKYLTKSEIRSISPASLYGLVAATDALDDAKWRPKTSEEKQSTGVCIGMGMVDLVHICETHEALKVGYNKVSPFFVPRILPNMAAGFVSMRFGLQGPNHTVSTACATGAHAIGDGFRFIQHGYASVMVCGGAEACISPLGVAGFCRIKALSTSFNELPEKSSRPFDKDRDGFIMAEGAAVLILEELGHALKRGANIYAEIIGYGLSGDAAHITAPHEEGVGAILAMSRALSDAGLKPCDVTYINAHATSTPLGDVIELKAINSLFAGETSNLAVSSTKGAHGHLLGAAGNLETLFTVLACEKGKLPPTVNLENPSQDLPKINLVPNLSQDWKPNKRIALKNSFGFGGTNACLCLSEFKE